MHYSGTRMLGTVSKTFKECIPAPMTVLRRPQYMGVGKPNCLATEPAERARILRMAWGPITGGNTDDPYTAAQAFMDKYAPRIPKLPEFSFPDLTFESFRETCQQGTKSAAGLDGSSAADLSILSLMALNKDS